MKFRETHELAELREELKRSHEELEKSRDSEKKMLESLASQTKELEQTKISLEESKLEIISLMADGDGGSFRNRGGARNLEKNSSLDSASDREELRSLRRELRLAVDAEEKSKAAMDALALALKEVTTRLSRAEREAERNRLEAERNRGEAERLNKELRRAAEDRRRLRAEAEESGSAWAEKEEGFIAFMKETEEENRRLMESLRASREESSRLRDIVKQAVNEANVVKEAMAIARCENSQLKDAAAEKEAAVQGMKQELENLKVSEAAALDSVRQLQGMIEAGGGSSGGETAAKPPKAVKRMAKFPSDHRRMASATSVVADPKGGGRRRGRRYSVGAEGDGVFEGSLFDIAWSSPEMVRGQRSLSFDGLAELKASETPAAASRRGFEKGGADRPAAGEEKDGFVRGGSEFGGGVSPARMRKKRQILQRFGDILRRRSFQG